METSSNPVFSDSAINKVKSNVPSQSVMTVGGTMLKSFLLLFIVMGAGIWAWTTVEQDPSQAGLFTFGASLAAFIVAMFIIFTKPNAILTMIYAALEGVMLGAISFLFSDAWQGIVLQAITITIAITLGALLLFSLGVIKVTAKLQAIVLIGMMGAAMFYLIAFFVSLFSSSFYDLLFTGDIGVIFAGLIVLLAAMNLLLDFESIKQGAKQKLPKQFEWYSAFGLMVTLVWLYLSVLRLLAVSKARN